MDEPAGSSADWVLIPRTSNWTGGSKSIAKYWPLLFAIIPSYFCDWFTVYTMDGKLYKTEKFTTALKVHVDGGGNPHWLSSGPHSGVVGRKGKCRALIILLSCEFISTRRRDAYIPTLSDIRENALLDVRMESCLWSVSLTIKFVDSSK